jgi:DICT domain-containing protein
VVIVMRTRRAIESDDLAADAWPYPLDVRGNTEHHVEYALQVKLNPVDQQLSIKEVAERTGLAAGTIRMWEQRYGFPAPGRTSAGYRRYGRDDVEAVRRVQAYRHRGLSIPAAIERARETGAVSDHASMYAAVAALDTGARAQVLRKRTLIALSRAIEHETLAHAAAPMLFAAFQRESFYREVEPRYRRLARQADEAYVFANFSELRHVDHGPTEVPTSLDDALGNEWAVVVDAPGLAACLLAWEQPGVTEPGGADDLDRRFEAIWTVDPVATRRAAQVGARLVGRCEPGTEERLTELLASRPLALEQPAPALTSLTNRVVGYLEPR